MAIIVFFDCLKVKDPDSEYATVYENWASSNGGVYVSP